MPKRKKSNKSIFKDLDRLFRGKPLVRRKIRPHDTRLAMPDKKSSGMAFFQKSVAPTYANITNVAYNISERLVRYQDFQEMEACVAGHTLIATPESPTGFMRIDELAELCRQDPSRTFIVYAYDHEKKQIVPTLGKQARHTITDHAWKVKFDSGKEIIATADHRLMLFNGTYCEVQDLKIGYSMMPFYSECFQKEKWSDSRIHSFKENCFSCSKECESTRGVTFAQILNICDEVGFNECKLTRVLDVSSQTIKNCIEEQGFKSFELFTKAYHKNDLKYEADHKHIRNKVYSVNVESIEYVGVIDLFDLTVDGYKNFSTDSVVSHNTPELARGLDVFSEEVVSQDEKGQVLHIHSDNEQINDLLSDLFYGTLNTDFMLRPCARNLCKYGDVFYYIDVSPEHGVQNLIPLPVNEIEREENFDPNDPFSVRFKWLSQNKNISNWEVAHFRMIGNDLFLPYGSSVLESARRIWRQLVLIEDAMLVYRIVRAPERRVFYVDIANIHPNDVEHYVEETRRRLRTTQVIDRDQGRVDLRYNSFCLSARTTVPLLDGRVITIKELINEWDSGKRNNEVYSVDHKNGGKIVPGEIIWAGKSGTTNKFVKLTLDDGTKLEVTPDHKMMLRDGNPVKAKDLNVNDSLMPCYFEEKKIGHSEKYEKVFDPSTGKFLFTHRVICAAKNNLEIRKNGLLEITGYTVHHINFDKNDNSTSNLKLMTNSDHSKYHAEFGKENIKKFSFAAWEGDLIRRGYEKLPGLRDSIINKLNWSEELQSRMIMLVKNLSEKKSLDDFIDIVNADSTFMNLFFELNDHFSKQDIIKIFLNDYKDWQSFIVVHNPKILGRSFVNNVNNAVAECCNNHKIISIEIIDADNEDVFNITVDNYHNFAVGGVDSRKPFEKNKNCDNDVSTGFVYTFQSVDEDYIIPVRGQDSATRIDNLEGGQNTAAVEDVEYIQKKLFAAIGIPRAYLGYDDMLSCLTASGKIKLLDGRVVTIQQLTDHFESKKSDKKESLLCEGDIHVYSADEKGKICPGKLLNTWKTRETNELYHVQIDGIGEIVCTANHPFMCRDGSYVRADQLSKSQSLMPLYKKVSSKYDHKVSDVWIENLDKPAPVYDLEVEKYSNFAAIISGINSSENDKNVENCVFLHNSKATLAQEDIRFSRTVTAIQKVIISELNKIAMIHLYVNGFRENDLVDFKLMLSNPSTIAQQQKLELMAAKFDTAANTPEGFLDREYVQREVLGLTDEEIKSIKDGRVKDRMEDAYLESIAGGAEGGGGGGGGDLFGGGGGGADFGGGEDLGGEEGGLDLDSGGDDGGEDMEDLEAADDHVDDTDEDDDDLELLLSTDDPVDKSKDPITPSAKVNRYNRNRRKLGANGTMPDFNRNLSGRNDKQDDPNDAGWFQSDMKLESSNVTQGVPRINTYFHKMLQNMEKSPAFMNYKNSSKLMTEEVELDDEIFLIEDEDKDE